MEITLELLEKISIRKSYVLIHGTIRKLSSGLILATGEHTSMDDYDIRVVKCGPDVQDLKPGDLVLLSNLSVEPIPVKECPDLKAEFYGYTPESFIKLYIRDENTSKE